jgi:hypothetical protein
MTSGSTGKFLGVIGEIGLPGTHDFHGTPQPLKDKGVGILLLPFQSALLAVDPNIQVVLFACSNLSCE